MIHSASGCSSFPWLHNLQTIGERVHVRSRLPSYSDRLVVLHPVETCRYEVWLLYFPWPHSHIPWPSSGYTLPRDILPPLSGKSIASFRGYVQKSSWQQD